MQIEEIENFLQQERTIEDFVGKIDWKEFEKFVKEIFSANSFITFSNFRFKTSRRFEIDIIASKNNFIIAADCKEWDKGRYKNSGLKKAAEDQTRRTAELEKFLKINPIARNKFKAKKNAKIIPFVITWHDENISETGDCFIVPVWKLNSFLVSQDFY